MICHVLVLLYIKNLHPTIPIITFFESTRSILCICFFKFNSNYQLKTFQSQNDKSKCVYYVYETLTKMQRSMIKLYVIFYLWKVNFLKSFHSLLFLSVLKVGLDIILISFWFL